MLTMIVDRQDQRDYKKIGGEEGQDDAQRVSIPFIVYPVKLLM